MRITAESSWGRIINLVLGVSVLGALVMTPMAGGLWSRVSQGVRPGVVVRGYGVDRVEDLGGYLPGEVEDRVNSLADRSFRPPIHARITPPDGDVWTDIPGVHVDREKTYRLVMDGAPGQEVRVRTVDVSPFVTAGVLESITRELGGFSTWGMGGGPRNYNLYLGAAFIDWTLLLPGEEFSFWGRVGVPTAQRGFEPAPVIVGESVIDAPGGGLCQVSTTLYNAAVRAGLEIVERHPHTMPVGYVGPGMDAAVAWGHLDLKFINSSPWPVIVRMGYAGGLLWAKILGPEWSEASDG